MAKQVPAEECPEMSLPPSFPRQLFLLWFQGWEDAPEVVKLCRRSWEHHHPHWQIHFLDAGNLARYVDLDDIGRWQSRDLNHLSDVVRVCLLNRYGGAWADATCFCCQSLDGWLGKHLASGFFAFAAPAPDRLLSSWFLAATPSHPLVGAWNRAIQRHWLSSPGMRIMPSNMRGQRRIRLLMSRHALLIPLFARLLKLSPDPWVHYLFGHCYRKQASFRLAWDKTPKFSAAGPHRLQQFGLLQPMSHDLERELSLQGPPMHKLTWKLAGPDIPEGSVLGHLRDELDRRQAARLCRDEGKRN